MSTLDTEDNVGNIMKSYTYSPRGIRFAYGEIEWTNLQKAQRYHA